MDYPKTEYEELGSCPFSDSNAFSLKCGYVIPCFPESDVLDSVVHVETQM